MATIVGSAAIRIQPDFTGFREKLTADLKAATQNLAITVKVDADTTAASTKLRTIAAEANRLSGQRVSITVDVDAGRASTELAGVQREADRLDGDRIRVQVDVDAARAATEIAAVSREANKLDGKKINLDVGAGIAGMVSLRGAIVALSPAITSVVSALGPLVGLLGALPGLSIGLGQSVGALGLAFHGVSDAIKAAGTAQKDAAKDATSSAATQVSAANQIRSAQEAVGAATRNLANVRRDNAAEAKADNQAVADAERSLADAHRQATQTMQADLEAIKSAQRDAARQQVDDLRSIEDAQKTAKQAQEDLTQARKDAVTTLRDLNNQSKDASLSAREAQLALQRQQLETGAILADPTKTALEKAQAQLDLEEAQQRVVEANQREAQSAKDANDANKKGIEGSDQVVSAKKRLADAEQALADARKKRRQDEADSERRIADLERQRAQDARDNAEAINKAEAALAQARAKRGQDAKDRQDALITAQQQLSDSQRSLVQAQDQSTKALTETSAAATAAQQAYDKLTPAGKAFVDQFQKVKGTLDDVARSVQEATLPGFTKFLGDVNDVLPGFKDVLEQTGQAFGDFAGAIGDLLKGQFGQQLHDVMKTNAAIIRDVLGVDNGGGMLGLIKAMGNIAEAARPLTRWLGEIVNQFGKWAENVTQTNLQNGHLAKFFDSTKETLKTLGSILGNVFKAIMNIAGAAFPSGQGLLKSLDTVTEKFANWTGTPEAQKKLRTFFQDIATIIRGVAAEMASLVKTLAPLIKQVADFAAKHPELVKLATAGAVGGAVASKVGITPGSVLGAAGGLGSLGGLLGGGGGAEAAGGAAAAGGLGVGTVATGGILAGIAGIILLYFKDKGFRHDVDHGFQDALAKVKDSLSRFQDSFSTFWDKYGPTITKLAGYWVDAFGTEVQHAISLFGDAISILLDSLSLILDLISGDWPAAWDDFKHLMHDQLSAVKDLWAILFAGPKELWDKILKPFLKDLPGLIWDVIKGAWHLLVDPYIQAWKELWSLVKDAFQATKKWFSDLPGNIWGWIKSQWSDLTKPLLNAWGDLWDAVKRIFNDLKRWFTDLASTVWGWIKSQWSDLSKPLTTAWGDVWDSVKTIFGNTKTFFTDLPGKVWGWISDKWTEKLHDPAVKAVGKLVGAMSDAWDKIQGFFKAPIQWIIDNVINGLIDAVNWVSGKLGAGDILHRVGGITAKPGNSNKPATAQASGGVLPGFTPGWDVHRFESPTGGVLNLSGGEAIMRPEFTRAVGGAAGVARLNEAAKRAGPTISAASGTVWPTLGHDISTYAGHDGVDINGPQPGSGDAGNPIWAFRDGTISYVGSGRGYGDAVFEVGNSFPEVVYGHTSARYVHAGEKVKAGQLIARVGMTGNASGPHLHFGHPGGTYSQALALLRGATSGGGSDPGGGGILDRLNPVKLITGAIDKIKDLLPDAPGGTIGAGLAKGVFDTLKGFPLKWAKDKATSLLHAAASLPGHLLSGLGHLVGLGSGSVQDEAKAMLKLAGWSNQWPSLDQLVSHESSWNPKAENPTSSASGLFQFLDSTSQAYGLGPHAANASVQNQIAAGLQYIRNRYHDPNGAWDFWQGHGYYAGGGLVPGSGAGDIVPGMLTPGEFIIKKDVVDRFGRDTFDNINRSAATMSSTTGTMDPERLDRLIEAIRTNPRSVADKVYVDTQADFQRLQQMSDWADRGLRV